MSGSVLQVSKSTGLERNLFIINDTPWALSQHVTLKLPQLSLIFWTIPFGTETFAQTVDIDSVWELWGEYIFGKRTMTQLRQWANYHKGNAKYCYESYYTQMIHLSLIILSLQFWESDLLSYCQCLQNSLWTFKQQLFMSPVTLLSVCLNFSFNFRLP